MLVNYNFALILLWLQSLVLLRCAGYKIQEVEEGWRSKGREGGRKRERERGRERERERGR